MKVVLVIFKIIIFVVQNQLIASQHPSVNTTSGLLIGISHVESHSFYNVPFAQAPIDDLRFKPPVAITYQGTLDVSVSSYKRCFQFYANCVNDDDCDQNYSEDCLNLEINVPSSVDLNSSSPSSPLLPVLFWIHGGAFSFGSATELKYDSRWLANITNTIVVSTNYRLDALGCLVFEDENDSLHGNQGIKDQQLALQWVQDNIVNFGGDRNKVTIFGESAGGQSVTMHLMSPTSRPLFKQAVIQSYITALSYEAKKDAMAKTDLLLEAIGCKENKLQCLKNTPAFKLMNAFSYVVDGQNLTYFDKTQPYRPVLDDEEFRYPPLEFFQSGIWSMDKNVIIGTTSDEGASIKLEFENETMSKEMFIERSIYYGGPTHGLAGAEKYLELVGNPDDPNYDYTNLLSQEMTDMMFTCPNRALARLMLQSGIEDLPLYLYVFDYFVDAYNCEEILAQLGDGSEQCRYPSHASELFYVFNSEQATGLNLTECGKLMSNMLSEFWGHFAHTGRPSTDEMVWPQYQKETQQNVNPWSSIRITAPAALVEDGFQSDICDFWDSTGFYVNFTHPEVTLPPIETTSGSFASSQHCLCVLLLAISVNLLFCFGSLRLF